MAAASARLCVETFVKRYVQKNQLQPPPRGCVLKLSLIDMILSILLQPPPRGCVLKPRYSDNGFFIAIAAASARLCVETNCQTLFLTF